MTTKPTKFAVFIPARYASTRFPGKPLAKIGGREMILRVVDQALKACNEVWVATDDERIAKCVKDAGYRAVMTSESHRSGTDRVMEAYRLSGSDADVVINIQGDEPFIEPSQIQLLMEQFAQDDTNIATLATRFDVEKGFEALFDPNLVKLTFSSQMEALYFSRSIIPYVRGAEWQQWLEKTDFYTHIGVYAYRASTLSQLVALPQSSLEKAESLEQLRWLQAGYRIRVALTNRRTIGIDTPADLAAAESLWHLSHP